MSLIRLESCVLGYRGQAILGPLDLEIHQGEMLLVVGPNGCGKSTLLKVLLGILKPLEGRVVRSPDLRLAYVPQRGVPDPTYPFTVEEMVAMGAVSAPAVLAALASCGLMDLSGRLCRELSGGQKQRAYLARAIAGEPNLLMLDEPAEGLDLRAERDLARLVREIHERRSAAVVQVSQLLRPIPEMAEVLLLSEGSAKRGRAADILKAETLSEVYGQRISVEADGGHLHVLVEEVA